MELLLAAYEMLGIYPILYSCNRNSGKGSEIHQSLKEVKAILKLCMKPGECLCRHYWDTTLEDGWVWELDSSSASKWSRHIIITIPGRAFANNLALGSFVVQLLSLPQASITAACVPTLKLFSPEAICL